MAKLTLEQIEQKEKKLKEQKKKLRAEKKLKDAKKTAKVADHLLKCVKDLCANSDTNTISALGFLYQLATKNGTVMTDEFSFIKEQIVALNQLKEFESAKPVGREVI